MAPFTVPPGPSCWRNAGDWAAVPPARHASRRIIHTVGPVWRGGAYGEGELLALCYQHSLLLASRNALRSIAFPSISTGAYRFPAELAAPIAVKAALQFTRGRDDIVLGRFPDVSPAPPFVAAVGRSRVGVLDLQLESDGRVRSAATIAPTRMAFSNSRLAARSR